MSEERRAFLEAICAEPDSDVPRLVFADWLDDHGEPERAELIRAQCELARLEAESCESQALFSYLQREDRPALDEVDWAGVDPGLARRVELTARQTSLLRRHGKAWKSAEAPAGLGVSWKDWRRGFLAGGTIRGMRQLLSSVADLAQRTPLEHLEVTEFSLAARTPLLARSGLLRRLRSLSIGGLASTTLRLLGASPDASHIRELYCDYGYDTDLLARALADSPHWGGLRSLDLRQSGELSPGAAEDLFQARHLHGLERLAIWGRRWPARTVAALGRAGFRQLRELTLFQCDLDDEAAEALASSPALRRLRLLELQTSKITGRGLTALLTSRHLVNLNVLNLNQNPLRGDTDLSAAPARSLRALDLQHSHPPARTLPALLSSPALRGVVWLCLVGTGLNDRVVEAATRAGAPGRLTVLNLLYNKINDRGAATLAGWPAAAGLRALHLNGNDFGTDGARALAASPHLGELGHLCVDRENIGAEGYKALRGRFGQAVKAL